MEENQNQNPVTNIALFVKSKNNQQADPYLLQVDSSVSLISMDVDIQIPKLREMAQAAIKTFDRITPNGNEIIKNEDTVLCRLSNLGFHDLTFTLGTVKMIRNWSKQ